MLKYSLLMINSILHPFILVVRLQDLFSFRIKYFGPVVTVHLIIYPINSGIKLKASAFIDIRLS